MNCFNGNRMLLFGVLILLLSTISVKGGWRSKYKNKWSKMTPSPTQYPTEEGEYNCNGYWTEIFDRDNPNKWGYGNDDERLFKLRGDGHKICNGKKPSKIICLDMSINGDYLEYDEYKFGDYDELYCTPEKGFLCRGVNCPDFGVKFCCPPNSMDSNESYDDKYSRYGKDDSSSDIDDNND